MDNILESRISHIARNRYHFLMNLENVNGVAYGFKTINGYTTNEPCIHVLVENKLPTQYISSANNIIPKTYLGIKTDVIEIGNLELRGFTEKIRPVQGGYSIGNSIDIHAATLGCIVTRVDPVSKIKSFYCLTNNHVITRAGERPLGLTFIQPGTLDGGTIADSIGITTEVVPIDYSNPTHATINYVDAGLVKLNSEKLVSSFIASIGFVHGIGDAIPNTFVKKSGRTTGLTEGKIKSINGTFNLKGIGLFKNQILSKLQNSHGDSGSLVLNKDNEAVALFFAGRQNDWALASPIRDVLRSLNVKILVYKPPI